MHTNEEDIFDKYCIIFFNIYQNNYNGEWLHYNCDPNASNFWLYLTGQIETLIWHEIIKLVEMCTLGSSANHDPYFGTFL